MNGNHQNLRGQAAGIVGRVLVPETMPLHELHDVLQVAMGWEALLEEAADALVKGRSTPHAPDQVSALVSRALQRGKLKSGNGTNGCLTPEILVVPYSWGRLAM